MNIGIAPNKAVAIPIIQRMGLWNERVPGALQLEFRFRVFMDHNEVIHEGPFNIDIQC